MEGAAEAAKEGKRKEEERKLSDLGRGWSVVGEMQKMSKRMIGMGGRRGGQVGGVGVKMRLDGDKIFCMFASVLYYICMKHLQRR